MIACRRLFSYDMKKTLALIDSRIDVGSRVCLTDQRVNQAWRDEVMANPSTYNVTHRVFGLFDAPWLNLDTVLVLKVVYDVFIVSMMISSKDPKRKPIVKDGYGVNTTELLDFALEEMEKEGFHICYSIIPNHPRWKKSDQNPNRRTKGRWSIEEVEHVPAGEIPKVPFHLLVSNRPFNLPMVVRRMTLNK